ncbi:uncharacterized protein majin [Pholidichthys leucotaenia]
MPLQPFSFPLPETRFFKAGSFIYKFKIRGGASFRTLSELFWKTMQCIPSVSEPQPKRRRTDSPLEGAIVKELFSDMAGEDKMQPGSSQETDADTDKEKDEKEEDGTPVRMGFLKRLAR